MAKTMPPAIPPLIAPALLLLELDAPVGTMIIVDSRVVVTTKPSDSVDLKKKNIRREE
jgi:hypothetical protein